MDLTSVIDTVLDRSVVLGYSRPGYDIRRQLPGWPAGPPRLDGKVVLVTGAGSGIGQAAAAGFARLGASVLALARNQERADQAARRIRSQAEAGRGARTGPLGDVRGVACDLSSLAEVYAFSDWLSQHEQRLDVLVNNAGVMPGERTRTVDGVELTFATHVLAPWVLTEQLTPLLLAAAPSRVINVTSGGQYDQKIPAGDLESDHLRYGPKRVYARTKREELVLTQQWAQHLAGTGVHVHAMHPGWADTAGVQKWMPLFRTATRFIIRSPEQGADTIVWLGGATEAIETTGLFWHDRRPRPATYLIGAGPDDDATREELWTYVEALTRRPYARSA
jgi:dehydrogenase/reductase SDR family protein 12